MVVPSSTSSSSALRPRSPRRSIAPSDAAAAFRSSRFQNAFVVILEKTEHRPSAKRRAISVQIGHGRQQAWLPYVEFYNSIHSSVALKPSYAALRSNCKSRACSGLNSSDARIWLSVINHCTILPLLSKSRSVTLLTDCMMSTKIG